ncbi:MAG: hypothetical protein Ct9H90mP2_01390 [Dehalococcoidia bacterium]|nr:MAG: hypothetical protein Ct9H90mP2_01390 [Dehalococcoidia bacterium]
MEHGSFDMSGLEAYRERTDCRGPTNSGHITPPVIVEYPFKVKLKKLFNIMHGKSGKF